MERWKFTREFKLEAVRLIKERASWFVGVARSRVHQSQYISIWVHGVGHDGTMALSDFGIENLIDLIKIHKDDPTLLERRDGDK
jgi:hypothetical protein